MFDKYIWICIKMGEQCTLCICIMESIVAEWACNVGVTIELGTYKNMNTLGFF